MPLSHAETLKSTSIDDEMRDLLKTGGELESKGDYTSAMAVYKQIAEKVPDTKMGVTGAYAVMSVYDDMGDIDGVLKTLHEIVNKYKGGKFDFDAKTAEMLVGLFRPIKLEQEGKYDEAIKSYKEIEKQYFSNEITSSWAGDAAKALQYYMRGKKDEALKIYRFHLERTLGTPFENWAKRGIARCS
jgi:tetratricopeptide (TPR) repeat protein